MSGPRKVYTSSKCHRVNLGGLLDKAVARSADSCFGGTEVSIFRAWRPATARKYAVSAVLRVSVSN